MGCVMTFEGVDVCSDSIDLCVSFMKFRRHLLSSKDDSEIDFTLHVYVPTRFQVQI